MVLDPIIAAALKETFAKLSAEGKLLTPVRLNECYGLFRDKFGPDALSRLDGEALLSTLHDHSNRSSLVYWLEFKDDDEFPARFGSIAGGSALKFRIYKSKDKGEWMRGDRNYPVAITLAEAIGIAREHRDELIAGVSVLESLPENGSDAQYADLQEQLDRRAPHVSDLAWGHKYFSLLAHEKLDDYHVTDYQHFHLIKMLVDPPRDDKDGRFMAAGRFMTIAKELAMPINHLTAVLNARNGRPYQFWRIGTSDYTGRARNKWNLMKDGGCVAIGWSELGDLGTTTPDVTGKNAIKQLIAKHFPTDPRVAGKKGGEVYAFVHRIEKGDVVVACDGGTALGIGRVTGPYFYDLSGDFAHRRPIEWLDMQEWPLPEREGLLTTLHEIKAIPNRIEIERKILVPIKPAPRKVMEKRTQPVPRLAGIPGQVQTALERKGQVILYGPPGTGKTFWAMRAAREIAAYSKHGIAYDSLSPSDKDALAIRTCTFHPNYGYEDFIEGYRPVAQQGQLSYELRDGLLKTLCGEASQSPNIPYILIVDEINRGDIPRIFGELITLLEKGKRGQEIVLPLSAKKFSVPPNVWIIGTMNTADRSIALLDTALRRRFGFIELMPDPTVLGTANVAGLPLGAWLAALNTRVREHLGRDGRNLQIGHSYLMESGKPIGDFATLSRAIREDVLPLLIEYCYEDFDALISIVGGSLVDKNEQRINTDLFDQGSPSDLVQALLNQYPELATAESVAPAPLEDEEAESDQGDQQT